MTASPPDELRWVVVGGARDSYQVPIALHETSLLHTFVTDWYTPLDSLAGRASCLLMPPAIGAKLKRRYSMELPSRVVSSIPKLLLTNLRSSDPWTCNEDLGRRAGEIAAKCDCGIVSYAHIATTAFSAAMTRRKILLQMQPHPVSVRTALQSDELLPELEESEVLNELTWPKPIFESLCLEPRLADQCIVASNYTRLTLAQNGVSADRISMAAYGVDLEFFNPGADDPRTGSFKVLFVGQPVRQKGLHYLLEAWRRLKLPNAELSIVARSGRNNPILSRYESGFTLLQDLDWMRLREQYRRADLVCLPSLSEGFGLVTLESLACGTPVLTSTATGSSEIISHGEDGLVVPAADLQALMVALEFAYSDHDHLKRMRCAARRKAERFPWSRFRQVLREAVQPQLRPLHD